MPEYPGPLNLKFVASWIVSPCYETRVGSGVVVEYPTIHQRSIDIMEIAQPAVKTTPYYRLWPCATRPATRATAKSAVGRLRNISLT